MSSFHSSMRAAACCTLTTLACLASAADKRPVPDPADPDAVVPATRYQSTLGDPPAATDQRTPAQNWKALNQTVGARDSMTLTMGDETAMPASPAQPKAEAPADPHARHKHKEAP